MPEVDLIDSTESSSRLKQHKQTSITGIAASRAIGLAKARRVGAKSARMLGGVKKEGKKLKDLTDWAWDLAAKLESAARAADGGCAIPSLQNKKPRTIEEEIEPSR